MGLVDYTTDLLKQAMTRFAKNAAGKSRYTILDLGASQGRNSLQLVHHVIKHLDASLPSNASPDILVLHEDQPANDFATLLDTLISPASYIYARPNIYTGVISKSFYEQVMPTAAVDIAVSYISAHWLSKTPAPLPGDVVMYNDSETKASVAASTLATWQQAAHDDLVAFLRLRAAELADHGSLCMTYISDNGSPLIQEYGRILREAVQDMVAAGILSSASQDRVAVPMVFRTTDEFLAAVAQVPELELHEYEHVPMDVKFPNATESTKFLSSVLWPSLDASMTEQERTDPQVRQVFNSCMAAKMSQPVAGASVPFFEQFTIMYFYGHLTRRPRANTDAP
ncbi:hypothetical protein Ae201684_001587 [Aphanomyces euteiches]|nr:hypothetical protein Ae201684_001587 [Aphanomyces euteiches]